MDYMRTGASKTADALIAALFAPVCVACRRVLDTPMRSVVCAACWQSLRVFTPPLCDRCGEPLPTAGPHLRCPNTGTALTRCRAVGWYDGILRDLIHALKYDERRSLAAGLAPGLVRGAHDIVGAADLLLVPVPLHPWRQWSRGFNQADDIARSLAVLIPHARVARVLHRSRHTRPQSDLDAEARRANVRDAFTLTGWTPHSRRRWAQRLARRRVVLVDDVMTTGATLEACARVLRDAGACEVSAVTLARVPSPGASVARAGL